MKKEIFVTVGTTKFDQLIKEVTKKESLLKFRELGYSSITLQIGNGEFCPQEEDIGIVINCYRFKKDIKEDINRASLVISHAGAGTCLEVLEAKKLLLVVVNENLMENHQLELASHLFKEGYLYYCNCRNFRESLYLLDKPLKKYPGGNINCFIDYLNKSIGF